MRSFPVTDAVRSYAVEHGSWRPGDVIDWLRGQTESLGDAAGLRIGDDQGQLLTMLTRLVGAGRAVEVGTFTGYPSLCMARAGRRQFALCCDVSVEWTAIADDTVTDKNAVAPRAFNDLVADDHRVEVVVLPAFDGLTIARKR